MKKIIFAITVAAFLISGCSSSKEICTFICDSCPLITTSLADGKTVTLKQLPAAKMLAPAGKTHVVQVTIKK